VFMTLPMALGSGDALLSIIIVGFIGTGFLLLNS
jgi:hypothetical protein